MELALEEEASGEGHHVALDATPINMAEPRAQSPTVGQSESGSSDSVRITKVVDAPEQDSRGTKGKEPAAGDDGVSSSQRKCRVIRTGGSSSELVGGYESQDFAEDTNEDYTSSGNIRGSGS